MAKSTRRIIVEMHILEGLYTVIEKLCLISITLPPMIPLGANNNAQFLIKDQDLVLLVSVGQCENAESHITVLIQ